MKKPLSPNFSFILGLCLISWSCNYSCADAFIGINWGRLSSQRLIPSMVVDLLLQNEINNVRIFQQVDNVLEAFYNSGINVTLGLSNNALVNYLNETEAKGWVEDKIIRYKNVLHFRYVTIGNNPFSRTFFNKTYDHAVDVLAIMQTQLNKHDMSSVKATIPHYTDVFNLTNTSRPSETDFREDIKESMVKYVTFLRKNDAPFFLSVFPIHFVNNNSLDFDFAFMDNRSSHKVNDGNATYTNAFELLYDSCHWALAKANASSVKIVIGAVGWPTDSYPGANVTNAERFYKSFLPFIASGKGTPMRPNQTINVFLNNLSDENRLFLELGSFQRHWGIYKFNGEPKYRIDFSGKGRDLYPSTAKGVIFMPNRWCVFNGNLDDPGKVEYMKILACNESDCSSLDLGGSCEKLTYVEKVSYAFNRYFQTKGQAAQTSDDKCHMGGLGKLVPNDPSNGICEFPVEILSAEHVIEGATFGASGSSRDRVHGRMSASAGLLALTVLWMIL
ncbi:glucan endo-1,3-beta-glucosidase 8-like [Primulina eburnea]|uniref:glucan endo-1,3-beta-glucosidase 8-like n=1 Tax=Primulina eburnea TaxID=1245227 RepID=UPI003C6C1A87